MKLIQNAFAVGVLASSAALVSCSGQLAPTSASGTGTGGSNAGNTANGSTANGSSAGTGTGFANVGTTTTAGGTGSVETILTIAANGAQWRTLSYTISGGPGGSYGPITQTVDDAPSLEWVSGGIVAGCYYSITVTGEDSTGAVCSGSSVSFCVVAGQLSSVALRVTCKTPVDAADAAIITTSGLPLDAGVTLAQPGAQCPILESVKASPAELLETEPSTVSATTNPADAAVVWSATGPDAGGSGTIGGFFGADGGATSSGNSLSFDCGSFVGVVTITAQTQLEVLPPGQDASTDVCSGMPLTSKETTIVCDGCGTCLCTGATPDFCEAADGGLASCTNLQTDVDNCGTCGTVCAGGDSCASGACTTPL
jgi:hypothetical protein